MSYAFNFTRFMQRLLRTNNNFLMPDKSHMLTEEAEKLAMISTQLAAKFLFTTGLFSHFFHS